MNRLGWILGTVSLSMVLALGGCGTKGNEAAATDSPAPAIVATIEPTAALTEAPAVANELSGAYAGDDGSAWTFGEDGRFDWTEAENHLEGDYTVTGSELDLHIEESHKKMSIQWLDAGCLMLTDEESKTRTLSPAQ